MIGKKTIWALIVAGALGMAALVSLAERDVNATTKAELMTHAKTDLEMLSRFITLDPMPEAALWESVTLSGGSDWTLTALITYAAADRAALIAQMPPEPGGFTFPAPAWLPDDTAMFLQMTEGTIRSEHTLSPTPFFKSPLLNGNALAAGETQLLIVLQTQ
ncbi:hypothetical protein ACJ5NV_08840 [Loktanella agnita]|uniref:hypothetical protein n=1 Tax=Loktanella agnita TaxID=287097 RepID=UPI003987D7FB